MACARADYWLAYWSRREVPSQLFDNSYDRTDGFYIGGLAVIVTVSFLLLIFRSVLLAIGSTRASFVQHDGVLRSILAAPMTFFDATPSMRCCTCVFGVIAQYFELHSARCVPCCFSWTHFESIKQRY